MPTVKDKAGNVIAELPYTAQGEKIAKNIVNKTPNLNVDYGENNTHDARSMRKTYHLGGEVPGDSRFGQNPLSPGDTTMQTQVPKPITPIYEEGGSVMTSGEREWEEYKKEKESKRARKDLDKSYYHKLLKREKVKLAKEKKRADVAKATDEHFGLRNIKERNKAKEVIRQEKRARIKAIKEKKETHASKVEMARFMLGDEKKKDKILQLKKRKISVNSKGRRTVKK